jgi:hypothetical protein
MARNQGVARGVADELALTLPRKIRKAKAAKRRRKPPIRVAPIKTRV